MGDGTAPKDGKIAVGSDHAGFDYKQRIVAVLAERGIAHEDMGTHSLESTDYVDYAVKVAEAVAEGRADYGVLICGTGVGMCIAANKVPGIRAAQCADAYTARVTREHNNANILTMGERALGVDVALDLLRVWLETPFSNGERHQRRLDKVSATEARYGERARAEARSCGIEPPAAPLAGEGDQAATTDTAQA